MAATADETRAGKPLSGRVALVTGAGRGIGRATAVGLASDGATVIVNDRDDEPAHDVVAEIVSLGGRALPMVASVADHDECDRMVSDHVHELGGVDIFVSNAGVASSGRSLLRTPLEEFDALMQVNTYAAIRLCQAVLPSMRERGGGSIVMISSLAVGQMLAKSAPYNVAKAALEALAESLANEERRHRIRVNIIRPGFVDTRLAHLFADRVSGAAASGTASSESASASDADPEGRVELGSASPPVGAAVGPGDQPVPSPSAMLPPDAIADAVRFYVSDAASHITGQTLRVA